MKPILTEDELERIRRAIVDAEAGTSAEIVPYVVASSDDYEVVLWRGAALSGALFSIVALLVYVFYQGWSLGWLYTGIGFAIWIMLGFAVGVSVAAFVPKVFRMVAGRALLVKRVQARARRAFIEEGIFRTEAQTGILIFVSIRERRIEVIADQGVASAVPAGSWERVVGAVQPELRRAKLAQALVEGIRVCGVLVREIGLTADPQDRNELGDELRIGPE
jgi:putative membrane protein